MRIDGFKCDQCNNICNKSKIKGWIIVYSYKSNNERDEMSFCSLECLINWTSQQSVDMRKIDVEGPIEGVVMSVEKHQGRLLAKGKNS
ncbi:MAG TPA: hypothetical protein VF974_06065 [Patescibacteria group bacterium]